MKYSIIEKPQNTQENIDRLNYEIDEKSKLGFALLWILDEAAENTNAYMVVKEAQAELITMKKRIAELEKGGA